MHKLVPIVVVSMVSVFLYYCLNDGFDPESIRGKRVFVTGASSGIGEQLAYEYCKLGAKVFITARRESLLVKVAQKCKSLGAQQVVYVSSDLGEPKDWDRVMAALESRLGGLDQLILNHAISDPGLWLGTRENMTKFLYHMNVNFISFVDLASRALPMLTASRGSIGVVSSVAGKLATAGVSSYSAAKHALHGFFSALRQEMSLRMTGISVTMCVIGPVDTLNLGEQTVTDFTSGFTFVETSKNTAISIMKGVTNRNYEIYFGRIAWVAVNLHKILPGYIEDLSGRLCMEMHNITV